MSSMLAIPCGGDLGSPVAGDVGGVVAGGGIPAGGDGLAGELKRDGPLDRAGGAVAGLPGAEDLPEVRNWRWSHASGAPRCSIITA